MSLGSVVRKAVRTIADEGAGAVLAKAMRRGRFVLDVAAATWKLRSEARRPRSLDGNLDFAYGFSVGAVTIAPAQVRSEIRAFLELIAVQRPRNILEIGTARGGTLFLLSRGAAVDARLASVDLPGGEFGGGYERIWVPLLKALPMERQMLKLIRSDSHDWTTYDEARRWFEGEPLDCLLIDGDHRFEGVRRDFLMYGPLVRPGGVIAFHDIVPGPGEKVGGVAHFWEVVKSRYKTQDLVEDWAQGGWGIGVLEVPPEGLKFPDDSFLS